MEEIFARRECDPSLGVEEEESEEEEEFEDDELELGALEEAVE